MKIQKAYVYRDNDNIIKSHYIFNCEENENPDPVDGYNDVIKVSDPEFQDYKKGQNDYDPKNFMNYKEKRKREYEKNGIDALILAEAVFEHLVAKGDTSADMDAIQAERQAIKNKHPKK
jgi:hypothetical protein